jgi:hypothetical protein
MSWANVAASVKWLPQELFLVDWTISPARANNEIDRITKATSTSIKEKPFDFFESFKFVPPQNGFKLVECKTYTIRFRLLKGKKAKHGIV